MAEFFTAGHSPEKINQLAEQWLKKDLEKGISIPFRYLKGGFRSVRMLALFWKNAAFTLVVAMLIFMCVARKQWIAFACLFILYLIYLGIGVLLRLRGNGSFIFKKDGVTIVTVRNRCFVPWEAIKELDYFYGNEKQVFEDTSDVPEFKWGRYSGVYRLVVQTLTGRYEFSEIYVKSMITDSNGRIVPAMMPLHVVYTLLRAAKNKIL